jgi:hypothetical protein
MEKVVPFHLIYQICISHNHLGEHPLLPTCSAHPRHCPGAQLFLGGYATGKLATATAECMPVHAKH